MNPKVIVYLDDGQLTAIANGKVELFVCDLAEIHGTTQQVIPAETTRERFDEIVSGTKQSQCNCDICIQQKAAA